MRQRFNFDYEKNQKMWPAQNMCCSVIWEYESFGKSFTSQNVVREHWKYCALAKEVPFHYTRSVLRVTDLPSFVPARVIDWAPCSYRCFLFQKQCWDSNFRKTFSKLVIIISTVSLSWIRVSLNSISNLENYHQSERAISIPYRVWRSVCVWLKIAHKVR